MRFEFERAGEPEPRKGKAAPGRAQLYINEKLVGQARGGDEALREGRDGAAVVVPEEDRRARSF